jgi:hypothetical protein
MYLEAPAFITHVVGAPALALRQPAPSELFAGGKFMRSLPRDHLPMRPASSIVMDRIYVDPEYLDGGNSNCLISARESTKCTGSAKTSCRDLTKWTCIIMGRLKSFPMQISSALVAGGKWSQYVGYLPHAGPP